MMNYFEIDCAACVSTLRCQINESTWLAFVVPFLLNSTLLAYLFFLKNIRPTRLLGPTRLIGTCNISNHSFVFLSQELLNILQLCMYWRGFFDEFEIECTKLLNRQQWKSWNHFCILIVIKTLDISIFSIDYFRNRFNDCSSMYTKYKNQKNKSFLDSNPPRI